jgi:hypothetical protein
MRIRHRKSRSRRRLDELALNVRTATWLGRLLWRPTLLQVVTRPRRHRLFARH